MPIFRKALLHTECDECGVKFHIGSGGVCMSCRRILCDRHLHGSIVRRVQIAFGATPLCVACRSGIEPRVRGRAASAGRAVAFVAAALASMADAAMAQSPPAARPARTILAIGAHAGDAELTSGLLLAQQRRLGDRTVILHLTLGEGGNPRLTPETYGAQKRREATAVAESLGAEVLFAPYEDGQLPDVDATRRYVADVIRMVKPTHIVTHWRASIHKDHAATHAVVSDAVLLASLPGVATEHPAWRGVRAIWYAENWEDADEFRPYVYVAVTPEDSSRWRAAVAKYEFVGGTISSFRYLDYYTALMTIRGAEARRGRAVAFDIAEIGKRRVVDSLP
jgi:LmbE family N-acetylglucosaminyl deacetylase